MVFPSRRQRMHVEPSGDLRQDVAGPAAIRFVFAGRGLASSMACFCCSRSPSAHSTLRHRKLRASQRGPLCASRIRWLRFAEVQRPFQMGPRRRRWPELKQHFSGAGRAKCQHLFSSVAALLFAQSHRFFVKLQRLMELPRPT